MSEKQSDQCKGSHDQGQNQGNPALTRTDMEKLILRIGVKKNVQEKPSFLHVSDIKNLDDVKVWDFLSERNEKKGGKMKGKEEKCQNL